MLELGSLTTKRFLSMAARRPLVSITGTTGTGKSQLAVEIARKFNGEIVNADALQLYKGLPVATNKIMPEETQGVKHHLLDCVDVDEEPWTVGKFLNEAQAVISGIHSRGKLPIVVGGTHYYVQSLLLEDNTVAKPKDMLSDQERDQRWPILTSSADEMMRELRELDAEAAGWWHPRDIRKIRNSLALCLENGRKVSDIYREQRMEKAQQGSSQHERYVSLCFHLHADRDALIQRLDQRVEDMLERGLLDEVEFMHNESTRLNNAGRKIDETMGIWVAIGYKEFAPYFEAQKIPDDSEKLVKLKADGIERTKILTRQYATRQERWVRNRLIPALEASGTRARFFVLDATVRQDWNDAVREPAASITARFLDKRQLPDPSAVGRTSEMISSCNKAERVMNCCEICQVTTTTASQWELHLASRKHKSAKRPRDSSSRAHRRGLHVNDLNSRNPCGQAGDKPDETEGPG